MDAMTMRAVPVRRLLGSLRRGPYPAPRFGERLRFAQVGQSRRFAACALDGSLDELETIFVDYRGDDPTPAREVLERFAPHVVLVFRPEILATGFFSGLEAATVGFLTGDSDPGRRRGELEAVDPGNFDRLIAFDPLIADAAAKDAEVWRSLPLPVADTLYAPLQRRSGRPRVLFVGRPTPRSEGVLSAAKQSYDLLHVVHDADVETLERLFGEHDVGINLHDEPHPSFEHRVLLHLAAGHLVVSEHLSPSHGLEPDIDFVEISKPEQVVHVLHALEAYPGSYDRIRICGRAKAELYRASVVYPRLIHDLYLDLAAFGTKRRV